MFGTRNATLMLVAILASATYAQTTDRSTLASTQAGAATQSVATTLAIATTQAATTRPIAPEVVHGLIARLSDQDWKQRARAQDGLVALGNDVIAQLQQAREKASDPEVRSALQSILVRIEENRVSGPSLVTLHFDDAPTRDVVAAISKQINAPLPVWQESMWQNMGNRTTTIHVERKPFWQVMQEFLPRAGLRLQNMGAGSRLTLMPGVDDQMGGPASYSGPFMVMADSAFDSKILRYRNNGASQTTFGIKLQVFVEPKVRLLAASYQPVIEEAVDDAGHSLIPPASMDRSYSSGGAEQVFQISANLAQVEGMTHMVARLKGYVPVVVLVRSETIELDDFLSVKELTRTIGDRRCIIHEAKKDKDQYTVKISILSDGRSFGRGWQRGFNFQDLQLLDDKGHPLSSNGSSSSTSPQKVDCEVHFGKSRGGAGGEPVKLVWEVPIEGREGKIPFEFTDLKLP